MPEMMPPINNGELFMCNTLTIRPECRLEYLRELQTVLPQAKALPGCLLLECGEKIDAPGTFILTERWRSGNEYVNEYLTLPFYQEYLAKTEAMYEGPRDVAVLSSVETMS
ncbi:putative quinol monooxygenase [Mycolicibacterium mengxianglii]|uniref:putative quinol monooxygenase n=1 Tax=Mycolicibacterium mengxianglii TaxID=2736649 RepID=UPI0018EF0F83|nr:antibiotic biosynthesis monooxygenase [Mycolicibacterium mengxianglii]